MMVALGDNASKPSERYISIGAIFIDDIRMPDGSERRDVLGGGAVHAVMGMRLWAEDVSLIAERAQDFEPDAYPLLGKLIDLSGLHPSTVARTPRAWQYFDAEGNRWEEMQTPPDEMPLMIPDPEDFPKSINFVTGVHLQCEPAKVPMWSAFLRGKGCHAIVWEPWDQFCLPGNGEAFLAYSRFVDVVSPNLNEARLLTGLREPGAILRAWNQAGVKRIILRMGEQGCLVCDEQATLTHQVAYPEPKVVDVTGAGNACVAGAAVGFARTGDVVTAAAYSNVSASFALRQIGALYPAHEFRGEACERLKFYGVNLD